MNPLILGAGGGVGRHLVTQALEAGHTVTAFVRRPDSLPKIGRADVAHFLLAQLDDPAYSRKIATISY